MSLNGELVVQTPMRAAIARRMVESKQQAPHFYVSTQIETDALEALIASRRATDGGTTVGVTAALVRATAVALEQHPRVNSVWTADGLLQASEVNVGVAIALPDGLIAPALLRAGEMGLAETSTALADLVARARAGRLKAPEISDGTFTLSNLGMFDVSSFSAIVTPPQVAILATARGRRVLLPGENEPRVARVMEATLSVDHRALDGADAAAFLEAFKRAIEAPASLEGAEARAPYAAG